MCGPTAAVTALDLGLSASAFVRHGADRTASTVTLRGNTCELASRIPPHDSPDALYSLSLPGPADLEVHTCASDGATDFDSVLHLVTSCYTSPSSVEILHVGFSHLMRTCHDGMRGAAFAVSVAAGNYTLAVSSESAVCGHFELHVAVTPAPPTEEELRAVEMAEGRLANPEGKSDETDTVDAPTLRTQSGCTCHAEWKYNGVAYHGCDTRRPRRHGAWCPVEGRGCGIRMHRGEEVSCVMHACAPAFSPLL